MSVVGAARHPTRSVVVPGGPLAVIDAGAGPPVLLVPGFTGSKEDFGPVLDAVVAAGHRVVAYDQRGQHESPGPDDPAAYTVEALGADLLALVAALDLGPAHAVGHSFGGLVLRAAALARPAAFASLTLLGSGPAAITGPRVERFAAVRPLLDAYGMAATFEALAALDPRLAAAPELREFLRRRWVSSSEAGLRAMGDALLAEPDRVDGLRATGLPVLVAHGEYDDAWSPAVQRDMAERLGAAYAVIPAALHSPAVENPDATAEALLSFWRSG